MNWTAVASQPPRPPRNVRYEKSFEEARLLIESDAKRFDELCAAVEYLIAQDAEACPELPPTRFRVAKAHEYPGGPILRVFFAIESEELCSAWWVDAIEDPSTELDDEGE